MEASCQRLPVTLSTTVPQRGSRTRLDFDKFCEEACAGFYHANTGPPVAGASGMYFRVMTVGFFEGLDSLNAASHGVWPILTHSAAVSCPSDWTSKHARPCDDFAYEAADRRRDPSADLHLGLRNNWRKTDSTRQRQAPLRVDSTTLEANAAMKSIVRRDTGENYNEYLKRLAEAEGLGSQRRGSISRRMDRKRKKKTSNEDWESPSDGERKSRS